MKPLYLNPSKKTKKYIRSLPSNLCIPFSYPTQNKSLGVSLNEILNYHIIIFRYLKHDVFRWSSFNSYKSPPTKTVFHNSAPPTPIFYFFLCYVIFSTVKTSSRIKSYSPPQLIGDAFKYTDLTTLKGRRFTVPSLYPQYLQVYPVILCI